ncbi:GNAT family N-acetyltransferase [Jatrophihabitans sp. GAS493]|uniref:GNAT family N-acetyltransferase n=1 Tax=Jatrophihabitans sp. GAS493 TaxID=1907575 RepID=UPI0012FE200E|nr:GNAT family N-acetyltransferase [Jatrophihabitans sp. GAS493]
MISNSWIGRRIVVRRVVGRGDDGRILFGDVVGDLLTVTATTARIESRSGPVEVDLSHVATAKVVEASAAQVLALEEVCLRGWRPEEYAELGGWILRANDGFTMRANTVLPLKPPGIPVVEAISQAREWYAKRGLPLAFSVPTEARRLLDAELQELGWEPSLDVHVMTARLDVLPVADARFDIEVELGSRASAEWCTLYKAGGMPAGGVELLNRHDRAIFAQVRQEGQLVAIGRGVVDDGWLGIGAVEVAPSARRRGLATSVMSALSNWGRGNGATRSYLQVMSDNDPAVTLYRRLGYWVHHDYRYRSDPEPTIRPSHQHSGADANC